MKKQSLLISDEERYGSNSPAVLAGDGKEKDRKTAPTIELMGKQVDAFCACELKPGESGTATVHYTVKSVKMGDEYGNDMPNKNSAKGVAKRVTLSITHVEAEGDGEDDEESPEREAGETPAEEKSEKEAGGDDDETPETPETDAPTTKRKSVSPKDAKLED